jgi:Ca2+-binding RTX toxin-like protein
MLVAVGIAGAARGSTVHVSGDRLMYSGSDEANRLAITLTLEGYVVHDPSVALTVGMGCVALDSHTARCSPGSVRRMWVAVDSGDDVVTIDAPAHAEVYSGYDDDDVTTGSGNDLLHDWGPGSDVLRGGAGDDKILPSGSTDTVVGGDGDDTIDYWRSPDAGLAIVLDGSTPDTGGRPLVRPEVENVIATPGDDLIVGTAGANRLDSLSGADVLRGGAGNDILIGGFHEDTLEGGPGDDRLDGDYGGATTRHADVLSGGDGVDTVSYASRDDDGVRVTLDGVADDGEQSTACGPTCPERDNVLTDVENLIGTEGNDAFVGDGDDNVFEPGRGDDLVAGGGGRDTVTYAYEVNPIYADLQGDGGDGTLFEDDTIDADVETLIGGLGNDELGGNAGANTLVGGEGDDVLRGGLGPDVLDGGPGAGDVVDYEDRGARVVVDLDAEPGDDGAAGEGDTLTGFEGIFGGSGDDRLVGSAADDILRGGPGSDELVGLAGIDLVDYSERAEDLVADLDAEAADDGAPGEADTIAADVEDLAGGGGDDLLFGNGDANSIAGGAGNDVIAGLGDADELVGGTGFDLVDYSDSSEAVSVDLDGSASDDGAAGESDTVRSDVEGIVGGAGNDSLTGNAGDNLFLGGPGADSFAGLAGYDLVDYSDHSLGVAADLDGALRDDGAPGEGDTIGVDVEDLSGSPAADVLGGDAADNFLAGGGGSDVVTGGPGSDLIFGDAGDDDVLARDGEEDLVECGEGRDLVTSDSVDVAGGDCELVDDGRPPAAPLPPSPPPPPAPPPPATQPPPPPARGPTRRPGCVVPRLQGKTLVAARRALTKSRCRAGKVKLSYSARVRRGRVIAQRPGAGKRLSAGARVNLTVSRGAKRR